MQRAGPWLFFLLGVTLTVGFYEGRRMVWNTMKAIEVVSSDWGEEEGADARRPRSEERRDRRRAGEEDPVDGRSADRKRPQAREKRGKKNTNPGREKLRERLKRAVQDLSPEEREMLKEEVLERRAERRAERESRRGKVREGSYTPEEGSIGREDAFDEEDWEVEVDDEELLEVLEEDLDEELLDTSEPFEP